LSPEDRSAIEAGRARPVIELELSAQPESIAAARRAVVALARLDHLSEAAISDVALAVSEAASNVVLHAYRDAQRPGPLLVRGGSASVSRAAPARAKLATSASVRTSEVPRA
jgi:hypothetical protein